MLAHLVDEGTWDANDFDALLRLAPNYGVFLNSHTFEVDLFQVGLHDAFEEAMKSLGGNSKIRERMKIWAAAPGTLDVDAFLKDIESVGKGRFAQRLASIIVESNLTACPKYILKGVEHVADKCTRG
jgi:putative ATP-dependent endonuclease of OLD family